MPTLESQKKPYQKILEELWQGENVATSDGLSMAGQSSEEIGFLH